LVWAVSSGNLSANPLGDITNGTGDWALRFLCVTLGITPLRRVTGWNGAIKFRRMLGLFAFFYGGLHFLTYVILDRLAGLDLSDTKGSWMAARALAAGRIRCRDRDPACVPAVLDAVSGQKGGLSVGRSTHCVDSTVVSGFPAQVEHGVPAASFVERRSPDNDESERLVEAARGGILFVDVDGERPAAEFLCVLNQPATVPAASMHGLEEQCLDSVCGQPQKTDRNVQAARENPQLERVTRKNLGDERPVVGDVCLGEKAVRGTHGALPRSRTSRRSSAT
jgi:hypothetical protein